MLSKSVTAFRHPFGFAAGGRASSRLTVASSHWINFTAVFFGLFFLTTRNLTIVEFLRIRFFNQPPKYSGDDRGRTGNLRLAKPALSQLSYIPSVGVRGFEPRTSALSELRSNQLSYTPSDETLKGFGPKRRMLKIFIAKFKWTQHRILILVHQSADSASFSFFSIVLISCSRDFVEA